MIHRFHEQVFQRMPPERRARRLAVMKSLVKSVKNKSKENGNPLNNSNMALSCSFTHSTPVKDQQITNLDDVESETEADTDLRQPERCSDTEKRNVEGTCWEEPEEPKLDISKIYDLTHNSERADCDNVSEGLENESEEESVTVLEVADDELWKSLEVLHETAEYEFCRSLEESKLFVSTSSLLEEIEADLPLPYSLAKPLNHTFHTLTSYRVQSRLARMDGNVTCPDMIKQSENLSANFPRRKINQLEVEAVVQKALAEQAEKALILSKSQKTFGVQYIESEKALLLANLRCNSVMQEMKRLRMFGEVSEAPGFGQITISDICFEIHQSKDNWPEKYVCTVTERENVQSTSVVSEVTEGKLRFNDILKFSNLSRDFVIYIDLFKLLRKEPKKLLSTNLLRKLKKVTTVNLNRSLTSSSYSTGGFTCVAQSELRLENVVDREDDKCALQNYLTVNLQRRIVGNSVNLLVKTDINLKTKKGGFLNVFKQTWHRKWFQQSGYFLESWLYPEDQESDKTPVDSLYLPKCRSVEPVGLEVCIRPHSFVINLKESDEGIIFSANSHTDMLTWVDHLSSTLELIRLWNPKA